MSSKQVKDSKETGKETAVQKPKGQIRVYGAGSCGMNIVGQILHVAGTSAPGCAELHPVFLDTSKSNVDKNTTDDRTYLLNGRDGSGGVRATNSDEIVAHTPEILQQFPPMDLNIVVHSGGGGSGSVLGPSLVSELLRQGRQVVVILVGGTDTRRWTKNTLDTIKSYSGAVNVRRRPVSVLYLENSEEMPRAKNDQLAASAISSLSFFFSRENRELDSEDLKNFLDFQDPVTSFEPQLAALNIVRGGLGSIDGDEVIAVASLSDGKQHVAYPFVPDYATQGFFAEGVDNSVRELGQLHLVLKSGLLSQVSKHLNARLVDLSKASAQRATTNDIVTSNDRVEGNGLVL